MSAVEVDRPAQFTSFYRINTSPRKPHVLRPRQNTRTKPPCEPLTFPHIRNEDLVSRRTERFSRKPPKKEKILRPSKYGYHRFSNTSTYKLLVAVSEKLQVLIDRKLSKSPPIKDDCCEYDADSECYGCAGFSNSNNIRNSGVTLDLPEYSYDDHSSDISVILTPLNPQELEDKPNTGIHLYLPKLSEQAEVEEMPMAISVSIIPKGDDSEIHRHHSDKISFFHQRHSNSYQRSHKENNSTRTSSTSLPKLKTKHKSKKTKSSSSKRKSKSSSSNASEESIETTEGNTAKSFRESRDSVPEKIDFLNEVTTLISEDRDSYQYSESSYVLPNIVSSEDTRLRLESGVVSDKTTNVRRYPKWCSMDLYSKGDKSCDNCLLCEITHDGCQKNVVSRFRGVFIGDGGK